MAKILADHEIKGLLGSVLIDADENHINPNGIELRLGKHVRFHSTGEEKDLAPDQFLKVNPGETVVITSQEKIDFSAATAASVFPGSMLMGLITPTTTMMREGISQVATKIDAGFRGTLNWGLRNGSIKELILQCGEPIFKLTIFRLEADEVPEIPYGGRDVDSYQDSSGIVRSKRHIPADIPKTKIICSSFDKLDPKKQLREAGHPFDHIGTELVDLQGKFETVSSNVRLLTEKIENETKAISERIEELREALIEKVEIIFERKFNRIVGTIIGAIGLLFAGITFLQTKNITGTTLVSIVVVSAVVILFITYLIGRRS